MLKLTEATCFSIEK